LQVALRLLLEFVLSDDEIIVGVSRHALDPLRKTADAILLRVLCFLGT
jgi:hypothetical protein